MGVILQKNKEFITCEIKNLKSQPRVLPTVPKKIDIKDNNTMKQIGVGVESLTRNMMIYGLVKIRM